MKETWTGKWSTLTFQGVVAGCQQVALWSMPGRCHSVWSAGSKAEGMITLPDVERFDSISAAGSPQGGATHIKTKSPHQFNFELNFRFATVMIKNLC